MNTAAVGTAAKRPRPEKTVEETIAGVRRQIPAIERRAVREDPWMPAEMLKLADELRAAAIRVIASYRMADPATGEPVYRWADIAFSLGITDISAIKRYKRYADAINAWPAKDAECDVAARRAGTVKGRQAVKLEFSTVPGQLFGPYQWADAADFLEVAGLLDATEAEDLMLGALTGGRAETESSAARVARERNAA